MLKRRPEQMLPPAKELTAEVVRNNPLLVILARERLQQQEAIRKRRAAKGD